MKKSILLLLLLFPLFSQAQCFDVVFKDAMKDYEEGRFLKALEKLDKSAKCPDVKNEKLLMWRDSCRIKIENQLTNSIELLKGLVPDSVTVFYKYFYTLAQNELEYCNFTDAARYMRFARLSPDLPGGMLKKIGIELSHCDSMAVYNERAVAYYRQFKYNKAKAEYKKILSLKPNDPIIEKRIFYCENPVFTKENLILVNGGTLTMGSNIANDETPHEVTLTDYYMYKTEITNAEYAEFLNIYGSARVKDGKYKDEFMIDYGWFGIKKEDKIWIVDEEYGDKTQYPVMRVSWFGANEFCKFWGGSLPSEAQWEYAARSGGKDVKYSWGDDEPTGSNTTKFGNIADNTFGQNYTEKYHNEYDDSFAQTSKTGSFNANDLGLYDMSGNVWEWCLDWYDADFYSNSKNKTDPINTKEGTYRVIRGGSWYYAASYCRVAFRSIYTPGFRGNNIGFRFVSVP